MTDTEHNKGTDRPEGTVDEDANPPLTDPTKTDVDRDTKTVPPQGSDPTKTDVHSEQGSKPPQDARLMGPSGT
jgi:hypothetical protein